MNTYYPIHILVAVPCPPSIRDRFSTQFGSQCHFTFINSSQTIPESLLRHTDVIIGEPDEPDLLKAPRLKWLQLTWAGAYLLSNDSFSIYLKPLCKVFSN